MYTIETVRDEFIKDNYHVAQLSYSGIHDKILCISPSGVLGRISLNHWKKGVRLHTNYVIDSVIRLLKSEGYRIVHAPDKMSGKIEFICPNDHYGSIVGYEALEGGRCGQCYRDSMSEVHREDHNVVKEYFKKHDYKLTGSYTNCVTPVKCVCDKGHIFKIRYSDFKKGVRCKECYDARRGDTLRATYDIEQLFKDESYTLLSSNEEYENSKTLLRYKCPKGHEGAVSLNNWLSKNTRCPKCVVVASKAELEIYDIVKSYFPEALSGDREIITPLELDIVIPSKKIAIEYCGIYYHSSNFKDKNYHLNKLKLCEAKGYRLITIFEDEFLYKKDIVLSRLKNILGVFDGDKVYARKCVIKEIDSKVKNEFLEENHIQGKDSATVKLGAFCKDELVSVITFSKSNIAKGGSVKKGVWELSRFCSKRDLIVIGAAGKLFKYFTKNYEYIKIYSYADLRWSDGNLYKVLDFKFAYESKPNYWYVVDNKRVHRFNFRKNVLKGKLDKFNSKLTEWENMKLCGFCRIFDCGNMKWEYSYEIGT